MQNRSRVELDSRSGFMAALPVPSLVPHCPRVRVSFDHSYPPAAAGPAHPFLIDNPVAIPLCSQSPGRTRSCLQVSIILTLGVVKIHFFVSWRICIFPALYNPHRLIGIVCLSLSRPTVAYCEPLRISRVSPSVPTVSVAGQCTVH